MNSVALSVPDQSTVPCHTNRIGGRFTRHIVNAVWCTRFRHIESGFALCISICTALFLAAFGLLALLATPAFANHVDTATVNPSCSSYAITLTASELTPNTTYTIDWTISGLGPTINDSVTFTPNSTWNTDSWVPDSYPTNGTWEFGTWFQTDVDGYIVGVRFWKADGETDPHTVRIWRDSDQAELARIVFDTTTQSGWQYRTLAVPLAISAGVTYVVSAANTNNHLALKTGAIGSPFTNGHITTLRSGWGGSGSGDMIGAFPNSGHDSNYLFREVEFSPNPYAFNSGPITKSLGPLTGNFTPTGSATLRGFNTIPIAFSPANVNCAASIKLKKQISVDGGSTWADADTSATAPVVTAPHDAQYQFIVTNTGNQDLSNVTLTDSTLGISNVSIGTLPAGQSMTITSKTAGFSNLNQPNRCLVAGTFINTASVTGTPVFGGPNVMASDPAVLICQTTAPPCTTIGSIGSNFNGTAIPSGDYIWFNSNFNASGVKDGTNIFLTGSSIQFTSNGTSYNVQVPDAVITFKANASCASTSFNAALNRWETTVPLSGSDEIFLSGVAFQVPAGFQKGINPVTWTGNFGTDTPGAALSWKWGAAAYTQFSTDYNQLGVKPTHTKACSYSNSDHAGTPENFKNYVTGGARGGGGSNFTGSWSGTASVKPVCK